MIDAAPNPDDEPKGKYHHQDRYRRRKTAERSEVPGLPAVADPERRDHCEFDLHEFLITYFPHTTGLKPFSQEQKDAIKRIEISLLEGGARVLNAFPRGFGKTTISENAAIWGASYGHCRFVPIVGADKDAASDNIESLKTEWLTNDLLAEDFPELAIPFRRLENKSQRCRTQTHNGELTHIGWSADELVQPYIKGADGKYTVNSGCAIRALGITGRLRGMGIKRPDGRKQRPDWFILDDPQTDQSARSPAQISKRLSIFRKAVLRLGGHDRLLAGVINATVIETDDMIDKLLDHKQNADIEGLRIAMMRKMADAHDDLWLGRYADIRRTYNPEDPRDRKRAIADANQFYADNRAAMDAGAEPTWIHCYADTEASAIQHAYNILIDDGDEVFASECQNQPIRVGFGNTEFLTAIQFENRRQGEWTDIPDDCEVVTFGVDVQQECLYFVILGVSANYDLYPIEYGVFPQQRGRSMALKAIRKTLSKVYPGIAEEDRIKRAVADLVTRITARRFARKDGVQLAPLGGVVDGGFQTAAVWDGIQQAGIPNVRLGFGRGLKAADKPMLQLERSKGERRSEDAFIPWRETPDRSIRGRRNTFFCTNSLKTFLHRRISTGLDQPGHVSLPLGKHGQYCEQVCDSEFPTTTEGPWGEITEWKPYPSKPDNHLLDATCMAIVAASQSGRVSFGSVPAKQARKRKRVSYL